MNVNNQMNDMKLLQDTTTTLLLLILVFVYKNVAKSAPKKSFTNFGERPPLARPLAGPEHETTMSQQCVKERHSL